MKNIFIEFDWSINNGRPRRLTKRYFAPGPVIALNLFHRDMQNHAVSDGKTVLRPKLQPSQYTIVRMFHSYNDAVGKLVENAYDLPATDNPDCTPKKKIPGVATPTMFDVEQY
jgi:hypothetical protein